MGQVDPGTYRPQARTAARPLRRVALSRRKLRSGELLYLWVSRAILWAAVAISVFPSLWVVTASLQPGDTFFSDSLVPRGFTLENYRQVLFRERFPLWLRNSLVLATGVAVLQASMTAAAAYAFSRLRFWGRRYGLMVLLLLQMFPQFMSLAALFALAVKLRIMDSLPGLILLMSGASAFHIWLLKSYIDSLPRELDEAAMVDGAGRWQVFSRVILPLTRPMLVVMFLFSFMGVYAEYILSSALIKSPQSYTVVLGLQRFIQNQFATRWTLFSAAAILASVPLVILWILLQRYVEAGLARGAVKL